jgi:hypothetical protein
MGGPRTPPPPPAPTPPVPTLASTQQQSDVLVQQQQEALNRGRTSTILTGGAGLGYLGDTTRKVLLGS